MRAEGVQRRLVGVEIGGPPIEFNMTRWPVRQDGQTIGQVTSAIYSPRLKENIGYAMVPVAHAALGARAGSRNARRRRAGGGGADAVCRSRQADSEIVG